MTWTTALSNSMKLWAIQKTKIMASGPVTSWQLDGKQWKQWEILFSWVPYHCRWWLQPWNQKMLAPWKKSNDQPRQYIKKWRHYFANKCPSSQSYVFSTSHVWMWQLDYKESWVPKNWCFWTLVLESTVESHGLFQNSWDMQMSKWCHH